MKNKEQFFMIVIAIIFLIWIIKYSYDEKFEICDKDGCRSPTQFMEGTGLVAAQPPSNMIKAYDVQNPMEYYYNGSASGNSVEIDKLDDGVEGDAGLLYAPCSQSCCTPQYPLPFKLETDDFLCKNRNKFVPTSYKCNNAWQNSGCVCMTKEQSDFLGSRGGNTK